MDREYFFNHLSEMAERDTAVRSTLRRSLGFDPGTYIPSFQFIEPMVRNASPHERKLSYLLAGLWATCKNNTPALDLATCMASLDQSPSVLSRFTNLLDSDSDELPYRLRQVISLLNSASLTPKWDELLDDLTRWNSPHKSVQIEWARKFFSKQKQTD